MKAVKAGYSFNLFTDGEVSHIRLKKTGTSVRVKGTVYPLWCGSTFVESQKVDALLDSKGEMAVRDHRIKERER